MFVRDVGVAIGSANARVTEELLDDTEIGAMFQEMRCIRVPQSVRRDVFWNVCPLRMLFY